MLFEETARWSRNRYITAYLVTDDGDDDDDGDDGDDDDDDVSKMLKQNSRMSSSHEKGEKVYINIIPGMSPS
jgi:hypothetical protein